MTYRRSADELGWREYPLRSKFPVFRVVTTDPQFYAEADVMEQVMNHKLETMDVYLNFLIHTAAYRA